MAVAVPSPLSGAAAGTCPALFYSWLGSVASIPSIGGFIVYHLKKISDK